MATITFKPEFENKLKKLKLKTRFVNNLKNKKIRTDFLKDWTIKQIVYHLNSLQNFEDFIGSAFWWAETPEGRNFWQHFAKS